MADAPPKRRGRPRLAPDDRSMNIHFCLPSKQYDLMLKHANEARLTLADWIRQAVKRAGQ